MIRRHTPDGDREKMGDLGDRDGRPRSQVIVSDKFAIRDMVLEDGDNDDNNNNNPDKIFGGGDGSEKESRGDGNFLLGRRRTSNSDSSSQLLRRSASERIRLRQRLDESLTSGGSGRSGGRGADFLSLFRRTSSQTSTSFQQQLNVTAPRRVPQSCGQFNANASKSMSHESSMRSGSFERSNEEWPEFNDAPKGSLDKGLGSDEKKHEDLIMPTKSGKGIIGEGSVPVEKELECGNGSLLNDFRPRRGSTVQTSYSTQQPSGELDPSKLSSLGGDCSGNGSAMVVDDGEFPECSGDNSLLNDFQHNRRATVQASNGSQQQQIGDIGDIKQTIGVSSEIDSLLNGFQHHGRTDAQTSNGSWQLDYSKKSSECGSSSRNNSSSAILENAEFNSSNDSLLNDFNSNIRNRIASHQRRASLPNMKDMFTDHGNSNNSNGGGDQQQQQNHAPPSSASPTRMREFNSSMTSRGSNPGMMADYIALKIRVAELQSELQVSQSNIKKYTAGLQQATSGLTAAQDRIMGLQDKNAKLSRRNADLEEENYFLLKFLGSLDREGKLGETNLEEIMLERGRRRKGRSGNRHSGNDNGEALDGSSGRRNAGKSRKKPELDWGESELNDGSGGHRDANGLIAVRDLPLRGNNNDPNSNNQQATPLNTSNRSFSFGSAWLRSRASSADIGDETEGSTPGAGSTPNAAENDEARSQRSAQRRTLVDALRNMTSKSKISTDGISTPGAEARSLRSGRSGRSGRRKRERREKWEQYCIQQQRQRREEEKSKVPEYVHFVSEDSGLRCSEISCDAALRVQAAMASSHGNGEGDDGGKRMSLIDEEGGALTSAPAEKEGDDDEEERRRQSLQRLLLAPGPCLDGAHALPPDEERPFEKDVDNS